MTTWIERSSLNRSLVCLLRAVEGRRITIELRDNSVVKGRLVRALQGMCVELKETVFTHGRTGHVTKCSSLCLSGTQIRYVHIPEDMDMMAAIRGQLDHLENPSKKSLMERKKRAKDKYAYLRGTTNESLPTSEAKSAPPTSSSYSKKTNIEDFKTQSHEMTPDQVSKLLGIL